MDDFAPLGRAGHRRRDLLRLCAGLPLLGLAACTDSSGASEEEGFATGDGSYTRIAPGDRKPVPELAGETLDGKKLSLADFTGQVVVLNVWGSWCSPCRHEAPQLVKAAQQTKGKAQFIGLNTRDLNKAQAQAFVRSFGLPFPSIHDPKGELLLKFGALPPKAIPSTLVIDTKGRMAARVLGETTASTLVGTVEDIAAGK
ncbi:TlpA family protein disulfide reductase [Luteococcus sp. OSA5]|uniref:TlpA family protein disulfide reductase n=1 Tax=Luteococcus sp. OSA5 TaxID=3401630 RepID=UPI003B43302F